MDELRIRHQTTSNKLKQVEESSNETELQTVLEDMSALMDEKQNLETKVEATAKEVEVFRKKLHVSDARSQELETTLDKMTVERKNFKEEVSKLNLKHQSFLETSQAEIQNYKDILQKVEQRCKLLEKQQKEMESELEITTLEMEEQKLAQKKTLGDLASSQENQRRSETDAASLLASKDVEINSLQSELQVLKNENRKRVEELTKQSDSKTVTNEELQTIKNELLRAHNQMEVSEAEKRDLNNQVQDLKRKTDSLTKDLEHKETKLSNLTKNLEETTKNFTKKFQDINSEYDRKLEIIETRHQNDLLELQDSYGHQVQVLEGKVVEGNKNLSALEEEKSILKHENSNLSEKIKFMEQELSEEFEKMQEKMQQASFEHQDQIKELKSVVERLTKELNQQTALVENLEEENKRQLELQEDKNLKNEQEFSQLHSAAMNETNQLKTAFDEEKHELRREHTNKVQKLKEEFQHQLEKLKESHSDELSNTLSDLKRKHQVDRDSLKDRIRHLEGSIKESETELFRAQNDLKALSDHFEKQEQKWKLETSEKLDELKRSHQRELSELQSETDELIQQNMHRSDANSINNELVQSQLMQLQDENQNLLLELQNLKNSSSKIQKNLDLKFDEVATLGQKVSNLLEQKKEMEAELNNLKDANLKLLKSKTAEQNRPPEAQNGKVELLKQQELNQSISTSCPNLNQVVDGLEKSDLSHEGSSTLLAVIKGTLIIKLIKFLTAIISALTLVGMFFSSIC